jgi:glycosyltransferase involved in cell wall biosynthesis
VAVRLQVAGRFGRGRCSKPRATPLISFVWSPLQRLPSGTGGSENYTVGHVRELNRRGIDAQVVTIGLGIADGREEFDDIPFRALRSLPDLALLDGTVVFVSEAPLVRTKSPAFQILHVPPPIRARHHQRVIQETRDRTLIATSHYAARLWSAFLDVDVATIAVVYPFAEPTFATQPRPAYDPSSTRILYAGRLSPEKGIYTFLEMLHVDLVDDDPNLSFTVTTAGSDKRQGRIIQTLVEAHPGLSVVPAQRTPAAMAALMATHDIVLMPSTSQYWHETFGIVSIEAQHAGCRVVASDDGGLPETDCGALMMVEPDNAEALAVGLRAAILAGPVPDDLRERAGARFTVAQSVDSLLEMFARPHRPTPAEILRDLEALVEGPVPA